MISISNMIANVDVNCIRTKKYRFKLWIREMTCEYDYMIVIPFEFSNIIGWKCTTF